MPCFSFQYFKQLFHYCWGIIRKQILNICSKPTYPQRKAEQKAFYLFRIDCKEVGDHSHITCKCHDDKVCIQYSWILRRKPCIISVRLDFCVQICIFFKSQIQTNIPVQIFSMCLHFHFLQNGNLTQIPVRISSCVSRFATEKVYRFS